MSTAGTGAPSGGDALDDPGLVEFIADSDGSQGLEVGLTRSDGYGAGFAHGAAGSYDRAQPWANSAPSLGANQWGSLPRHVRPYQEANAGVPARRPAHGAVEQLSRAVSSGEARTGSS